MMNLMMMWQDPVAKIRCGRKHSRCSDSGSTSCIVWLKATLTWYTWQTLLIQLTFLTVWLDVQFAENSKVIEGSEFLNSPDYFLFSAVCHQDFSVINSPYVCWTSIRLCNESNYLLHHVGSPLIFSLSYYCYTYIHLDVVIVLYLCVSYSTHISLLGHTPPISLCQCQSGHFWKCLKHSNLVLNWLGPNIALCTFFGQEIFLELFLHSKTDLKVFHKASYFQILSTHATTGSYCASYWVTLKAPYYMCCRIFIFHTRLLWSLAQLIILLSLKISRKPCI